MDYTQRMHYRTDSVQVREPVQILLPCWMCGGSDVSVIPFHLMYSAECSHCSPHPHFMAPTAGAAADFWNGEADKQVKYRMDVRLTDITGCSFSYEFGNGDGLVIVIPSSDCALGEWSYTYRSTNKGMLLWECFEALVSCDGERLKVVLPARPLDLTETQRERALGLTLRHIRAMRAPQSRPVPGAGAGPSEGVARCQLRFVTSKAD